jgi:hypothetical protein
MTLTRRKRTRVVLSVAAAIALLLPLAISAAVMSSPPPSLDPPPTELLAREHADSSSHIYETRLGPDEAVVEIVRTGPGAATGSEEAGEATRYFMRRRGNTWEVARVGGDGAEAP